MNKVRDRPYRMVARQESVDQTREQIMQAMFDLFPTVHYDELTLSMIADAAGVSRQTVHRQFGTKDDLAIATIQWVRPRVAATRSAAPGEVEAAIAELLSLYEMIGDSNVRMLELEGRTEVFDEALTVGRSSHRAWVEHVFAPWLPAGADRRDRAVVALYAATDVMLWKLMRRDFRLTVDATRSALLTLVRGVLRELDDPFSTAISTPTITGTGTNRGATS